MMRRSRSSQAWLLRQMMYRRIMLPCLLLVTGVVGAVEREIPQRGEMGLYAV
jgi:hypothetical protein